MNNRLIAIVVHYRQENFLKEITTALRELKLPVLIVDDASGGGARSTIAEVVQSDANIDSLELESKNGRGACLKRALVKAVNDGFTHALTIDADMTQNIGDLKKLIDEAEHLPKAVISGCPLNTNTASDDPKAEYIKKLHSVLNALNACSLDFQDTTCGLRVYPLEETCEVINQENCGDGIDFDTEILIRLNWRGTPIKWIDIAPVPADRPINNNFTQENTALLISKMHARLFAGMVKRKPKEAAMNFINKHFIINRRD